MNLLALLTELEFLCDNQDKIMEPEDRMYVRNLWTGLNGTTTFRVTKADIDKVGMLFEDAQK